MSKTAAGIATDDEHDLIKTLVYLLRNLAASVKGTISSGLVLSQLNFPRLLADICLLYSNNNQRSAHLKAALQALLNFSTLTTSNKEVICSVPGALGLLIRLIGPLEQPG